MTRTTLPANDNNTSDETFGLTEKTIAGFGAVMLVALGAGAVWLVAVLL